MEDEDDPSDPNHIPLPPSDATSAAGSRSNSGSPSGNLAAVDEQGADMRADQATADDQVDRAERVRARNSGELAVFQPIEEKYFTPAGDRMSPESTKDESWRSWGLLDLLCHLLRAESQPRSRRGPRSAKGRGVLRCVLFATTVLSIRFAAGPVLELLVKCRHKPCKSPTLLHTPLGIRPSKSQATCAMLWWLPRTSSRIIIPCPTILIWYAALKR